MKKLFNITFIALVLLLISASPKAFADFSNWGDRYPNYSQGSHDYNNNDKDHHHHHPPVAAEPLNVALFLAGSAALAIMAFRKRLLTA